MNNTNNVKVSTCDAIQNIEMAEESQIVDVESQEYSEEELEILRLRDEFEDVATEEYESYNDGDEISEDLFFELMILLDEMGCDEQVAINTLKLFTYDRILCKYTGEVR